MNSRHSCSPPLMGGRSRIHRAQLPLSARYRRTLSPIAAVAAVAQPEAHQEALALRLRPVGEIRSGMAGRPVVDELNLARLEIQIDPQLRLIEHRFDSLECGRRPVVHSLTA